MPRIRQSTKEENLFPLGYRRLWTHWISISFWYIWILKLLLKHCFKLNCNHDSFSPAYPRHHQTPLRRPPPPHRPPEFRQAWPQTWYTKLAFFLTNSANYLLFSISIFYLCQSIILFSERILYLYMYCTKIWKADLIEDTLRQHYIKEVMSVSDS